MAFDQQFNWDMDRMIKDLTAQRKKRLAFNQDISSREMAETERQGRFERNQKRSESLSTGLDKNYDRQLANDRITSRKHDEYAVNDGSLDEKIFGMRWGASGSSGGGGVKPGGSKGSGANSTGWDLSGKDRADLFARAYQYRGASAADEDFGTWLARNRKGFDAGNQVGEQIDPAKKRKDTFGDTRQWKDDNGVFHASNWGPGGEKKTPDGKATNDFDEVVGNSTPAGEQAVAPSPMDAIDKRIAKQVGPSTGAGSRGWLPDAFATTVVPAVETFNKLALGGVRGVADTINKQSEQPTLAQQISELKKQPKYKGMSDLELYRLITTNQGA